jgi:hypothetical protein
MEVRSNKMKRFTSIACIFLMVISILHILRIVLNVEVLINGWDVPLWINGVAAIITGFLSIMLWKERHT